MSPRFPAIDTDKSPFSSSSSYTWPREGRDERGTLIERQRPSRPGVDWPGECSVKSRLIRRPIRLNTKQPTSVLFNLPISIEPHVEQFVHVTRCDGDNRGKGQGRAGERINYREDE